MRVFLVFLYACVGLSAQEEFDVVRKKALWLDQEGALRIGDSGVCFIPKGGEEMERCWDYADIQHLDRVSNTEIVLLSYEDVAWKLGRDRSYRFVLADEPPEKMFERLAERIAKPVTDRVVKKPAGTEQSLDAKHLKTLGGSEGSIHISAERIVYLTEAEAQSRSWLLNREVASVWSSNPYRLEVHVYEGNAGTFPQARAYKFALKRPLDGELYRRLKLRLYEIDRERAITR